MASISSGKKTIPWGKPFLSGREKKYVAQAINSTWISGGGFVDRFEREFLNLHEQPYGLTVSNGTTALQLALLSLNLGPGDEVIVPGYTFVAAVNMVIAVGATPVYADIDPRTWCVDVDSVKKAIGARTKAIMAVHIYGNVCDMEPLKKLATAHQLFLIEDNAESLLSKYQGRYAGAWGDVGCFSFQATKTIAMGEGGFVMTSDKNVYNLAKIVRDHGMQPGKKYWHDVIGYNFRLTNLQAAFGLAQLEYVPEIIVRRRKVFEMYQKELFGIRGIEFQYFPKEVDPVVWAIGIKINPRFFKTDRDGLIRGMAQAGVEMRPGFYPIGQMPLYKTAVLPQSKAVGLNVLLFPSYPSLTDEEISDIVQEFRKFLK